ncbi:MULTISPECIES: MotE family protein [Bombella]|uniref:Flagellar motility protein MotE, a chaperone for MotC folding n=1 Tax=Bombella pollinis TaxID=2967337 RepID=A0ABT3WLI3_9PROT|nr:MULTISPECIES: hypothetical protein [Bombella]MCX5619945.1 hypothetical protein [Bombella pollinis]MUG05136.1 hypothetical protein [Bombella sp. ESL0378]MUG90683.1 hypothetical protein [Bombella sp. ESL0385]
MRGRARAVKKPGFSLSKITNLASCLMTVLLALNLHSLAAQISQPNTEKEPPKNGAELEKKGVIAARSDGEKTPLQPTATGAVPKKTHPTTVRVYVNKLQGWTPLNGLAEGDPASGEKDEDALEPRVKTAEQGLNEEILAHRQAMQGQAEALKQQQKSLEAEQKELDEKLQALGRNASELSAEQDQRRQDVEHSIDRLARIYEQMSPRDAAAMFDVLDMRVMVPVAQHMIPRRISEVIGNMTPDRANVLSQYLAGIRKLSPDAMNRLNSPVDCNIAK